VGELLLWLLLAALLVADCWAFSLVLSAERFRRWMLLPGGGLVAFWRLWRRIS
jgi:hypothetical protein